MHLRRFMVVRVDVKSCAQYFSDTTPSFVWSHVELFAVSRLSKK